MSTLEEFPGVLRDTARSLRDAGDIDLQRELSRSIRDSTRPVLAEIRAGLPLYLPNRYAAVLAADVRLNASVRLAPKAGAKVTLKAASRVKRRRLKRLNDGVLLHPLFGNRKHWYAQSVKPGFFTGPAEAARPEIRQEIKSAMDDVAEQAARRHA